MSFSHERFLEAADFLGATLSRDAIWSGRRCNWFGESVSELRGGVPVIEHRVCRPDLYSGTSGIAVFLAHLHAATGERIFRTTAEGAIRQALSQLDDFAAGKRIGFYTGLTGVAYALLELAETCNIQKFTAMALLILEEIGRDEVDQNEVDVLSGSAGVISPLLKIYRQQPRDFLLQMAIKYGEHLLEIAKKGESGWTWPVEGLGECRAGFARGISGIAWALLELFQATGQEKFRHAAEEGFQYERQRSLQTYAVHAPAGTADVSLTWSEGAAGIGLTRLRAFQILSHDIYLCEAQVAIQTITRLIRSSLSQSEAVDFSPAQGFAGAAELLLEASRFFRDPDPRRTAETVGAWGIERYRKDILPWPCGAPGGAESPSLMVGLAGIGYFYLRLHDSLKVPSLLLV